MAIYASTERHEMRGKDGGMYEIPYRAHEENPVLVGIRTLYPDGLTPEIAESAAKYLTGGTHCLGTPITPEHSEHARRVLGRMARVVV